MKHWLTSAGPSRRIAAVTLLLVLLVPQLPLPEFWITLANYIGIASLVVLGLVLLTGIGGMTSFGQAAFVGLGAYSTAYLSGVLGYSPWLGLLAGWLLTGCCAVLIGLITLRLAGHYLPLGTIAWGLSLYYLFGNLEWLGKYDGLTGIPPIALFGWQLDSGRRLFVLIWLMVLLALAGLHNLLASRSGRAIRTLKGGLTMAEAMGVDTGRIKIIVFTIAALLASCAGWLYAHLQRAVNPTPFGLNAGIEYLLMAVAGGIGQLGGAITGSVLVLLLKDKLQNWLPLLLGQSGNFEMIVFGLLLILLLQYARDGIWPRLRKILTLAASRNAAAPSASQPPHAALQAVRQPAADHLGAPRRFAEQGVLLEVAAVSKQFGGLCAVNQVSFQIGCRQIVSLIGPNGAGKSTMFNLLTGVLPLSSGQIFWHGDGARRQLSGLSSRRIAALGVARSFQHVHLLKRMSVLENVAIGAHLRAYGGDLKEVLQALFKRHLKLEQRLLDEAAWQLQRVGLLALAAQPAGSLALGQQRIVEIARALCAAPQLLLLDEPAAGLRHQEKQQLAQLLQQLRADGMSILLVEHDMDFVMKLSDHLIVMEFGSLIAEGTAKQVQNNPAVLQAYLGGLQA